MVFVLLPVAFKATWTGTMIVQVAGVGGAPLAGMVPFVKVTDVSPGLPLTVPAPQVVVGAPATVTSAGRLSVMLTPVYGEPVGFCNVMVNVLVPPATTALGANAFVTPTG